jgi:hypothetical protein
MGNFETRLERSGDQEIRYPFPSCFHYLVKRTRERIALSFVFRTLCILNTLLALCFLILGSFARLARLVFD